MTMQNSSNEPVSPPPAAMAVVSRDVAFDSYKRGLEPTGIDAAMRVATALAKTGYGGTEEPEQVLAKMMFGRELGLTVMNSLRSVYVVNGRPGLDANVMHALCLQSPACEYFDLVETTAERATYRAKRRGRPEQILSWTIDQAKAAGLLGGRPDPRNKGQLTEAKDNWRNYPENMLRARCIANLARICFPEAINGMHTPEELETSTVPTPPPTVSLTPTEARLGDVADVQGKHAAVVGVLKGRILAASSADEKKALRAEFQRLKDTGELPDPWLAEVAAAYNERFQKKHAPPVPGAAQTEPSPPPPADATLPVAAASEPREREPGEEG